MKNNERQIYFMNTKILLFILIHVIGAIIAVIIHYKTGIFEEAAKNGDGFRTPRPSDIFFLDLLVWEIQLLLFIYYFIEDFINNLFNSKKERRSDHEK